MAVFIAMLRAANLGSHQKLNMQALRKHCAALGFEDVQTYIQSGNLVFRDQGDPATLSRRLEDGIEAEFGFRPPVVLRTAAEMRKTIAQNPFARRPEVQPNRLLVFFMAAPPTRLAVEKLLSIPCEPEELRPIGREVYIHYPNGMARPAIPLARMEKVLQCPSTGRNWNTVLKLAAMAEAMEASQVH